MGLDVFINEIKINEDVDRRKFINNMGLISKVDYNAELLKNKNLFNKLKLNMIEEYNDLIYKYENDLKLYKEDTKKYLNLYKQRLNYINNISQDKLISDLKKLGDTILISRPSIYTDLFYSDILKYPYIEVNNDKILYYRKEWDVVELVTNCLEKTFKDNIIKSNYIEIINGAPYLINGDVIKEIISYLEASIKDLQNQLKNDYDIIENVIIDELDMYERWLSDFKLLDINKEYAFVISY